MRNAKIEDMIGQTFTKVTEGGDTLRFTRKDGTGFLFYHEQDCCESVNIDDICGDLSDLEGYVILIAEAVDNDPPEDNRNAESETWTFYKFATINGYVTVRWYGSSNGYYSEAVNLVTF